MTHDNSGSVTEYRCVMCGCRWLMYPPFPGTRTLTFSLKNAEHKPCMDCDGPRFERVIVPVECRLDPPDAGGGNAHSKEGEG